MTLGAWEHWDERESGREELNLKARHTHIWEQLSGELRELARGLALFFDELTACGFTRDEALILVQQWHARFLCMSVEVYEIPADSDDEFDGPPSMG